MKPISNSDLIKKLRANAEVNRRAAYFLMNHVVRDDNPMVVESAKRVASVLQKRAISDIKRIEALENKG